MKNLALFITAMLLVSAGASQSPTTIILSKPNLERGLPVMKALSQRASAREFGSTEIELRDLSDLLWAANGINRPEEGKRTAASALNAQDIDVYVVLKSGIYFYDPAKLLLALVADGDHRQTVAGRQENFANTPLFLLLVSDISRFRRGEDVQKREWAAIDAGIVAQNIMLFCASESMLARPRSWMERDTLTTILQLKDTQYLILNIPVSYQIKE